MIGSEQNLKGVESHCLAGSYLIFKLDHESYGINLQKVRDIIRSPSVVAKKSTSDQIRCIIGLHGAIIPTVDLRGSSADQIQGLDQTCAIVVQVALRANRIDQVGLIVDDIEGIISLKASQIQLALQSFHSPRYVVGTANVNGVARTLLDIDSIIGADVFKN